MFCFSSSLIRVLAVTAVTTGVLLNGGFAASAETGNDGLTAMPSSPPPSRLDLTAPPAQSRDTVVLGVITPEEGRQAGPASLKGGVGGTRGGNTPHTSADDFKAGPGCSIQCITSGVAYARGVGANLVVHTDTAATIWIIVWSDDGYHRIVQSDAGQTQFAHHFDDLEPGTLYYAMASAEDGEGYTSYGYGDFTTLTRTVHLTFTQAIIQASPYGDDDYSLREWFMGELIDEAGLLDPEGDTLPLGINLLALEDAGQFLTLQVELLQSDGADDLCEVNDLPEGPSIGTAGCNTWAYAEFDGGELDIDHRPAGATSWTHHVIQTNLILPDGNALPGSYGQPLAFYVPVSIEVTYE